MMSITNRFSSGRRNLNRKVNRKLDIHATRMLPGVHRPPPPNLLAEACRNLNEAIRIRKRMAKREPHLFGPKATAYFLETVEMAESEREFGRALQRIYGCEPGPATVWRDRYPEFDPCRIHELVKKK